MRLCKVAYLFARQQAMLLVCKLAPLVLLVQQAIRAQLVLQAQLVPPAQ